MVVVVVVVVVMVVVVVEVIGEGCMTYGVILWYWQLCVPLSMATGYISTM